MDKLIFLIVHHSTSDLHTYVLKKCINSINEFHSGNRIIICKTSTSVIPNDIYAFNNVRVINTPLDGSHIYGAIHLLVNSNEIKDNDNYVLMHDSMILIKRLPDTVLDKRFYYLWHFATYYHHMIEHTIPVIESNPKLTTDEKREIINLYHTGMGTKWIASFGPAFGGNITALKILHDKLNITTDELPRYACREHIMGAERYLAVMATWLNLVDYFDGTMSLNNDIHCQPDRFVETKSMTSVDNINTNINAYMWKYWLMRPVIEPEVKRVAICLRGAMAKKTGRFETPGKLYNDGKYVNYRAVYNSIKKHIIDANSGIQFDFFIQSWNPDLKHDLIHLYQPKSYLFEDNNLYRNDINHWLEVTGKPLSDYGINSHHLAISKSINILKNYVESEYYKDRVVSYDLVILYRPDVILFKDMVLSKYDKNAIYVNAHPNAFGDFHLVMNLEHAYKFSQLYETTKSKNRVSDHGLHGKLKVFTEDYIGKPLIMDDIIPGQHQEVLRRLKCQTIDSHKVPIETFYQYGLTDDEIMTYLIDL